MRPAAQREFGLALALLRTVRGWRQQDLARAVGIQGGWISLVERGERGFSLKTLHRLTAAMGFPLSAVEEALSFVRSVRGGGAAGARARGDHRGSALAPFHGRLRDPELARALAGLFATELPQRAQAPAGRLGAPPEEARRGARQLLERLAPYRGEERRALARELAEFQSWALVELLCHESERTATDDAARAIETAELALEIASLVREEEAWRLRLEGYCWAFLGNARRVAGDLPGAEEALRCARETWDSGGGEDPEPLDARRLLDLEASLCIAQRRLPEAVALLERALALQESGPAAARLLLKKAKALEEVGDFEGAVAAIRRAASLVEEESEPRLALVLRFNLAYDLHHLGRAGEAEALLPAVRARALALGNRLDLVRLCGLEGLIAGALDRPELAEALLRRARGEFLELGIAYDAALMTLELAVLFLSQGRTADVKALAGESAAVFAEQRVVVEVEKALGLFFAAAQADRLTVAGVRRLLTRIEGVGERSGGRLG